MTNKQIIIEIVKSAVKMARTKLSESLNNMIQTKAVYQVSTTGGNCTIAKDFSAIKVEINLFLVEGYYEDYGFDAAYAYAYKTVRHEFAHARQWAYVAKKYGWNGICKMTSYIANHDYKTSILEIGARMYEDPKNAKLQDLKDLDIFAA